MKLNPDYVALLVIAVITLIPGIYVWLVSRAENIKRAQKKANQSRQNTPWMRQKRMRTGTK